MQPRVWAIICNLELSVPLGSHANYVDLLQLFGLIDIIDWRQVPLGQSGLRDCSSDGTSASGFGRNITIVVEFIQFDLWELRQISYNEARGLRDTP